MGKYYKYKNLEENRFQEFDKSDILSGPLHIAIDITNKCNAKCLHCFNRSGNGLLRNEISDREMLEIFKEIAVIKPFSTCFCGGEPMMKYDLVLRATEVLKNGGVPNIAMVTNGWFLTKDRVISLRNAGLTHIQLSLDGKDAKTHERMRGINGIYEKVLDALNFIDDAGISSAVAFSPTQFNIKQFPEVVELLQKFENLREIKVQPLMPLGKAVEGKSELFASEEEYRELVAYIERFNASRIKTTGARNITSAVSHSACTTAQDLNASLISTITISGRAVKDVAKYRPSTPILACTPNERTLRQLNLIWGCTPMYIGLEKKSINALFDDIAEKSLVEGISKNGDLMVFTGGTPLGTTGSTNTIKVGIVGNTLLQGKAVVKSGTVVSHTNVIHTVGEAKLQFRKGDVFITSNTDKGLIPYMMKAAAIVVGNTEGDEFTHAADLGRELKIPVILCKGIDVAATIPDTLLVQIDSNKATVSLADR